MNISIYFLIILLLTSCGTTLLMSGSVPFVSSKPFYFNLQILDNSNINPSLNKDDHPLVLSPDVISPPEPLHTMQ